VRLAGLLERVKNIGEYRDALLVLISVDYLLGYFSWSFYAAENDLGLVPALDAQYLVAGVLPTVILAGSVALAAVHVWFSKWTATDPSEKRFRWGTTLSILGVGLGVAGFTVGQVLADTPGEDRAVLVAVIGAYILMLGTILQGPRGVALLRYYGLGVLWLVVLAVPLVLVLFYVERLFPYVPASLGGPSPRCVYVDLATDSVSSDTVAALVSTEPPVSLPIAGVRRTRELDLLFSGPEFVMVRLEAHRPRGPVYALAKDAIRALAPCAPDTQRADTKTLR
jgi:hypothetical protein